MEHNQPQRPLESCSSNTTTVQGRARQNNAINERTPEKAYARTIENELVALYTVVPSVRFHRKLVQYPGRLEDNQSHNIAGNKNVEVEVEVAVEVKNVFWYR